MDPPWADWEAAAEAGRVDAAWLQREAGAVRERMAGAPRAAAVLGVEPVDVRQEEWLARWDEAYAGLEHALVAVDRAAEGDLAGRAALGAAEPTWAAYQEWRLAVAGLASALDVGAREVELMRQGQRVVDWREHHSAMTSLEWVAYRAGRGDDPAQPVATKPHWSLLLQVRAQVQARRAQLRLWRGQLYEPVAWSRWGGRALENPDQPGTTLTVERWLWRDVLGARAAQDPELMTAVRTNRGLVAGAAAVLGELHGGGLDRARVSHEHVAFRDCVVATVSADGERPELRRLPDGAPELEGLMTSTAHDVPFAADLLELPLPPAFQDGEGELEGERLLAWLRSPDVTPLPPAPLEDAPAPGEPDDHLGRRAAVLWHVITQHGLSAQAVWLFLAMLARPLWANRRFDGSDIWMHVRGPPRSGKGVAVLNVLKQLLGPGAVGQVNMSQNDQFALAGALQWRVIMVQELGAGREAPRGLPAGEILSIVNGEPFVLRRMKEDPVTVESAAFGLMTTGNGPQPFAQQDGEMDARCFEAQFRESFVGREDTTLEARRRREVAPVLALVVRVYARTVAALGAASLKSVVPRDVRDATRTAQIASDYLTLFMRETDWVVRAEPDHVERYLRLPPGDIRHPRTCPFSMLEEMREAFRLWMAQTAPRVHYPWVPSRYGPVLRGLGLAWGEPGAPPGGLNAHVPLEGQLWGAALTEAARQRVERRRERLELDLPGFQAATARGRADSRADRYGDA